jgi:hypothetical protein
MNEAQMELAVSRRVNVPENPDVGRRGAGG